MPALLLRQTKVNQAMTGVELRLIEQTDPSDNQVFSKQKEKENLPKGHPFENLPLI